MGERFEVVEIAAINQIGALDGCADGSRSAVLGSPVALLDAVQECALLVPGKPGLRTSGDEDRRHGALELARHR